MSDADVERKLVAILSADVVGYSRLMGADMIICPAPDRSFYVMDYETHLKNINACISGNTIRKTLPGLSGSQTPETLYQHYHFLEHDNFAICPGGAVYEHPMGIEAGARSFVQAVDATNNALALEEYALAHDSLRQSLIHF